MKSESDTFLSDQSLKPRKLKSRGVSSRYLSSTATSHDRLDSSPSPSQASSPVRHKTGDTRKHRSLQDSAFIRGLWPSSSPSHPSSKNKNVDTLADHLGNDRLRDFLEKKNEKSSLKDFLVKKNEKSSNRSNVFSLNRQRSCSEYGKSENEKEKEKENHRPILGGSMRYTGRLHFLDKISSSPSSSTSSSNTFLPGRLSVDENVLYKNSKIAGRKSDSFIENMDAESDASENLSASDSYSSAVSKNSRKCSIEVSSKYRRNISESSIQHPVSLESSPKKKNFTIKTAIKRANSLTGYGSATSQWALSPGRSGSPPISVESKERLISFSSLKPPSSPSRSKGVEKLLNLGLDLFKGKKSSSSSGLMVLGSGNSETIHQLRLLHNRMLQWRYANARAEALNWNMSKQVEKNLVSASDNLEDLRKSVMLKRLQVQKERLEMKLEFILKSQIKQLEAWGAMERQHLSAVLKTKEGLHSVVCRIPLIEGAKVDPQLTGIALRQASDLSASINSALTTFSLLTEKNTALVSELAEVVLQEKLVLEECLELLQTISMLEIQERSLKCCLIQFTPWLQHQQRPLMTGH